MAIRTILADDHRLFLEGTRGLLANVSDIDVVGQACDGPTTLTMCQELQPDVLVVDVGMPGNGIDVVRELSSSMPQLRSLVLTMRDHRLTVFNALRAGACGYLLKVGALDDLVQAIRVVASGETYLCPRVAGVVAKYMGVELGLAQGQLSAREQEVLKFIARGKCTKEVGALLGISSKTVDAHRKQIMDKVGLHSVAELTRYAIREGVVALEE